MADNKHAATKAPAEKMKKLVSLSNIHLSYEKAFEEDGVTPIRDESNGKHIQRLNKVGPGDTFEAPESDARHYIATGAARAMTMDEGVEGVDKAQLARDTEKKQNEVRDQMNINPEAASKAAAERDKALTP